VTTVSANLTGIEAAGVDPCPHCGTTTGVQLVTDTPPRVRAWSCTACDTNWAITDVKPRRFLDHLTATVELAAARSVLREIITLADQATMLTDEQLRFRLRALAECTRSGSYIAHRSPADRWLSEAPDSAPSGQPVPNATSNSHAEGVKTRR
jgi:hypothetical protein